jgi:hypothetical protein
MSRRSFLLAFAILVLLLGGGIAGLALLLRYEPPSYQEAAVPPGRERKEASYEFTREFTRLLSAINNEEGCVAHFSDEQINSYFDEQFIHSGLDTRILPENISRPRVLFEPNRIRLAFRYGQGLWSTVVSLDMRLWLAKSEANVVLLELESFRAGALPITPQSLLKRISEAGQQNGIEVTWYRQNNGNPVALLRFQSNQQRPGLQLRAVQLEQGRIRINLEGRPHGPTAPAVALSGKER